MFEASFSLDQHPLLHACQHAPIGIAFLSLNGEWLKVNPAFCEMLGYHQEEFPGSSLEGYITELDLPEILSSHQQLLQKEIHSFQLDIKYIQKSGSIAHGLLTGCLLPDAHGNPLYFVHQIIDHTDRKKHHSKLAEIEQRHKSLIRYTPVGICALNDKGIIIDANPACEQITGYSVQELIQKPYKELLWPETIPWGDELFRQAFFHEVTDVELPIKHKTGKRVDLLAASSPIIVNGDTEGIYVIAKDVTESKETEELLRRSEKLSVIGELAAGVAHEIRNPLMSLRGFVQLLQREVTNRSHQNYYSIMLSEVDRINSIVGELLLLAKPERRKYEYKDIVNKLCQVIVLLQAEANLRNIQFNTKFESKLPLVYCEGDKIKQVFVNVIKNAIEAMDKPGEILIHVRRKDQQIHVQIHDQGQGISNDDLSKIGQPFFTTKELGTGLGLVVCYRIIENHQGRLHIESKPGKGTVVEIVLPINHQSMDS